MQLNSLLSLTHRISKGMDKRDKKERKLRHGLWFFLMY